MPTLEEKVLDVLKHKTTTEKIDILERINKRLRQKNGIRINKVYSGVKVDDERPDLMTMKDEQ